MLSLNLPTFAVKVIVKERKQFIFDVVRNKYVPLTPEEWVRQHFVNFLIQEKGYPKELLGNEITIRLHHTTKRCDTVAYDRFLVPFMIVEYKSPAIEITRVVFDQIVRYNMALHVRYLIVSNGLIHYCCQIDYDRQKYTFLEEIPKYGELTI